MSETKRDIQHLEDVQLLVNTFYDKIRIDALLGPIFNGAIKDWTPHLEKMYRFWQTILLEEHTYSGSPFPPHSQLPIEKYHFDRWLQLWAETVQHFFEGVKANDAIWRSERMALTFWAKISYYRQNNALPLR